jgi:pectin methylesterase-like acyl-CoA thioesterase
MRHLGRSLAITGFVYVAALATSTSRAQEMFPAPDAKTACVDTPIRLTFNTPPTLGKGTLQVLDAGTHQPVDTLDLSAHTRKHTIGGLDNFNCSTALVDGNTVTIPLLSGVLQYSHTYTVTIDPGALGNPERLSWSFTTKSAAPAADAHRLTVSPDGTADFTTVQGALDAIPDGNTAPITIFIRTGTYREIIAFSDKSNVTLLGEDRKKTIIAYANNDKFNNDSHGNPFADKSAPPSAAKKSGAIYRRGLFLAHRVSGLTLASLTLRNTTPQGGSQAEAIILNGTPNAHALLANVDLYSFQDTLQINGQAYLSHCYIQGDVDFMWGTGPCFFEGCTATSTRSKAYYTQIRNPPTNHGYVYHRCTFDGADGIADNFLARIDPARFPASEVVLLDCTLTPAVGEVAWKFDKPARTTTATGDLLHKQGNDAPDLSQLHFWEYNSHSPDGKPTDTAQRLAGSKQLVLPQDKETIDNYSNPTWVLGGWTPAISPDVAAATNQSTPK